jgi:hypothetical protein
MPALLSTSLRLIGPWEFVGGVRQQEALGAALLVQILLEDDHGGELIDDLVAFALSGDASAGHGGLGFDGGEAFIDELDGNSCRSSLPRLSGKFFDSLGSAAFFAAHVEGMPMTILPMCFSFTMRAMARSGS